MLEIDCIGTPWQIGYQHGKEARDLVEGSLEFYKAYFLRKSKMDWQSAVAAAERFMPFLEEKVPDLVEEMRGVAEGANVPFGSVLALNARTEISMGLMEDGCTSLAWKSDQLSLSAQNWDWEDAQKSRLIVLSIKRSDSEGQVKPAISQVTEAGIIGKIGLNAAGVGVCLNAIRARGVNFSVLPVHLALRTVLDSLTREEAVARLRLLGVAAASHILVSDNTGATSLESSAIDLVKLEMRKGQIAHTNHFLAKHAAGVTDAVFLPDSMTRMDRINELLKQAACEGSDSSEDEAMRLVVKMLEDEDGFPTAINRKSSPGNPSSTLFSIVMNLRMKVGFVKLGRPTEHDFVSVLRPGKFPTVS